MKLENQSAVVYAGARGIGKAYCDILLQKGCKVCFGDILEKEGEETLEELQTKYGKERVVFQGCDVRSEAQVEGVLQKAVSAFGSVNIVVANAGICFEKDWEKMVDINLGGVIRAFKACLPHMAKCEGGKGGVFMATSSFAGVTPPVRPLPVYAASKHAVVGYLRTWAQPESFELTGIRTGCLCPKNVDTRMLDPLPPGGLALEQQRAKWNTFIEELPGDQLTSVEEVAIALVTMLEDDASNGKCMLMTKSLGQKYVEFPAFPAV